jgi:hypothetical protein
VGLRRPDEDRLEDALVLDGRGELADVAPVALRVTRDERQEVDAELEDARCRKKPPERGLLRVCCVAVMVSFRFCGWLVRPPDVGPVAGLAQSSSALSAEACG